MATDVNGIISAAQDTAKEMADNAADFVRKAQLAFDTRYEIPQRDVPVNFTDEDFTVGVVPQYRGQTFTEPTEPGRRRRLLDHGFDTSGACRCRGVGTPYSLTYAAGVTLACDQRDGHDKRRGSRLSEDAPDNTG